MSDSGWKADPYQKKAIEADSNIVVSAGAGAGKTAVLAERYLRLVTERGLAVDEILCLTYTKKAAAEMRTRIHSRLAADSRPLSAQGLARFDRARISTIDAFCAALVRGAGGRFGITPNFSVDEKRLDSVADQCAVDFIMEQRAEPALRRLVASLGFDRLRKDLFVALATKELSLIRPSAYQADTEKQLAFAKKEFARVKPELDALIQSVLSLENVKSATYDKAQAALKNFSFPYPEDSPQGWETAARIAMTLAGRKSPKLLSKPTSNTKQAVLLELSILIDKIRESAIALEDLAWTLSLADDHRSISTLLDVFAERFVELKRKEGTLGFRDIAEAAVALLKEDLELRAFYKKHIRAIMIDEFQDDNETQKELLYLLAERDDRASPDIPKPNDLKSDALFFVGDEKQSIYRFRGADVSVFRKLAEDLALSENDQGQPRETACGLLYNYRSNKHLISFFNDFFKGVLVGGNSDEPWEARFESMEAPNNDEAEPSHPVVEFHILDKKSGEDDEEEDFDAATAEATAAAERIIKGVLDGKFSYDEIAVLFRSTTNQSAYERVFRRYDIPFIAADPRGVFAEGPANDFYALCRLLLYPGDRNAYAALLRCPLIRLGDDAFARIMLDHEKAPFTDHGDPAWFSAPKDEIRFARGRDLFVSMRALAQKAGIADLLSYFWFDEGYRAALLKSPNTAIGLDHYELLRGLALDADRRGLALVAFLDELGPLMGSFDKIESGEATSREGAVRFMTIHKSKGLEFPLTILADAGNKGLHIANKQPYYIDPSFGLTINIKPEGAGKNEKFYNPFFERSREREAVLNRAELRRLLYVAATRAESRFWVFASKETLKSEAETTAALNDTEKAGFLARQVRLKAKETSAETLLDLIAAGLAGIPQDDKRVAFHAIPFRSDTESRRLAALSRAARAENTEKTAKALAAFYARPSPPPIIGLARAAQASGLDEAAASVIPAAQLEQNMLDHGIFKDIDEQIEKLVLYKELGTLCHALIEAALTGREVRSEILTDIKKKGASNALIQLISASAKKASAEFLKSDLGREAGKAKRRRSEFPFIVALKRGAALVKIHGQMDLIYEYDGRCVIIDFKSDRVVCPEKHRYQLAAYQAAAPAFSDYPTETWLYYLRYAKAFRVNQLPDRAELAKTAISAATTPA